MTDIDRAISQAHLEAAGWELEKFVASNPFECHFFYVRDFRTDHIQVFTVKMASLEKLEPAFAVEELAGTIAYGLKKLGNRKLSAREKDGLPAVVAAYFRSTVTYRMWRAQVGAGQRLHGVINIYVGGHVRPFIPDCREPVFSVKDFLLATDQVKRMDQEKHPEWFGPHGR